MNKLFPLLIFISLIFLSFSFVPNWVLTKSSIDLLPEGKTLYKNEPEYKTLHKGLYFRLQRKITKNSGEIKLEHFVQCHFNNPSNLVIDESVVFQDIESAYTDQDGRYYICPKGSYQMYFRNDKLSNPQLKPLTPDGFKDNGEWELRCYDQYHEETLFVFYLNKEEYIYKIKLGENKLYKMGNSKYKILSYRWTTNISGNIYPMYAVIEKNNKAYMVELDFNLANSNIDEKNLIYLFEFPNQNHWGLLNDDSQNSKFYYFSYEADSINIKSGYSNNLNKIESSFNFVVNHNTTTPLEFTGYQIIEYIKFIPYTKYVYYKVKTQNHTSPVFYGIIDIELNKVIYNTNEKLEYFIPHTNHSMLAITSNSAYEICTISSNNKCVDSCENTIAYIIDKPNECVKNSINCNSYNKYTLMPNNICIQNCDTNFFYYDLQRTCTLCKDLGIGKPYKMMAENICLANKLNNSHYVNEVFKVIICDTGYEFVDKEECAITQCYESCKTCSEKSDNADDQRCIKCKDEFGIFYNKNCLKECPKKSYQKLSTCEPCNVGCEACNENGCTSCDVSYFYNENNKACKKCHNNCYRCSYGGDDQNNNCTECSNNYYLVKGGDFTNNCVTECPNDTVIDNISRTCNYIKPENNTGKTPEENSTSNLMIWIFVSVVGFFLILVNAFFCCKTCCCKGEEDDVEQAIQTELTDANLAIN